MKNIKFLGAILISVGIIASCNKKDDAGTIVPLEAKTAANILGDTIIGLDAMGRPYGSGRYTFFSLENNSVISNSDSATNKWDIAFRGTTIITNSGNSGPANGGGFVYTGTFESLSSIPGDSTIRIDNAPSAYAITSGSGKGWYTYNPVANLITPIPGRILVIRTATGKYAKVEILNYYKNGVTPAATESDDIKLRNQRYYKFRFIYQANGTKAF
ncbi:MAG: HmuY family protein [Chitinophagaceae bacterium]